MKIHASIALVLALMTASAPYAAADDRAQAIAAIEQLGGKNEFADKEPGRRSTNDCTPWPRLSVISSPPLASGRT
jgi:hypothetical protein